MKNRKEELYDNLLGLVHQNEAFYFQDFEKDSVKYRIFNYRYATYEDFLFPDALECRGVMFSIDNNENMIDLVSRPMQKFFNYKENPFTENPDFSKTKKIMVKEDGSLISTYLHDGELCLKSKGSIASEQCIDAMKYLEQHERFKVELLELACLGYTVNLEWTSPDNRIVLGYLNDRLTVLNIRDNETGKYLDDDILVEFPEISSNLVSDELPIVKNIELFVAEIPERTGFEGYVFQFEDDSFIKFKTKWYLERHKTKELIQSKKHILVAILDEYIDDIRSMFFEDDVTIDLIDSVVQAVEPKINHMMAMVDGFYETNKHLSQKDYAMLAKKEMDNYFHLCMAKYAGREVDWKKYILKNVSEFLDE